MPVPKSVEPAKVYFYPTAQPEESLDAFSDMLAKLPSSLITGRTAIKMHFGEPGNPNHVSPAMTARVIDWVRHSGGDPLLCDTNTLYRGRRGVTPDHLAAAAANGFSPEALGIPVRIADDPEWGPDLVLPSPGKHRSDIKLGGLFRDMHSLVVLSHFKGHLLAGFGGALKNIGMGMATRAAKQFQHADALPAFKDIALCTACGTCVAVCPTNCVSIFREKARFDTNACIGCAECIAHCPPGALKIIWNASPRTMQERMVEHAAAALAHFGGRTVSINVIARVSADCDCMAHPGNPLVPDIGFLAGVDPVSVDQASLDLVNAAPVARGATIARSSSKKFQAARPDVDPTIQLETAETLGIGTRRYELVTVKP